MSFLVSQSCASVVLIILHFLAGIQTSSPSSVQARERKAEKTEEKANIVGTVWRNRGERLKLLTTQCLNCFRPNARNIWKIIIERNLLPPLTLIVFVLLFKSLSSSFVPLCMNSIFILTVWSREVSFFLCRSDQRGPVKTVQLFCTIATTNTKAPVNSTLEKFENAALFLRLGLPSTLIRHENGAFRKRSSNPRNLKTPALRFSVDGRHLENETFRKRWLHDHVISLTTNTNPKWPVIVAFSDFSGIVRTENIWCVFRLKAPFSNFSGTVWMGPKELRFRQVVAVIRWLILHL